MAYKLKGFEIAVAGNGNLVAKSTPSKVAATNRTGTICPGKLICVGTDGADGWATADGVAATCRGIYGMCKKVLDTTGRPLDIQYLGTTTAGFVEVWDLTGVTLRGTEDGAGTPDTLTSAGSVPGVVGTITGYSSTETSYPDPLSNDLLDSSEYAADKTTNVFLLDGLDPRPVNQTANNQTWLFHILETKLV